MKTTLSGSPDAAAGAKPGAWAGFGVEIAAIAVFNTVIAAALYAFHFGGSFWQNWVFSQCIGMSILLFVDGGRRWRWRGGEPSHAGFLGVMLGGCLGGLLVGVVLGTWLLGLPFSIWRPSAGHSLPVALGVALVATGLASWYGWSRARLAQLKATAAQQALAQAAVEKQLVQAQLQALQAQIEPHFLFNVLANLDSLIASDPARARLLLGHLNRFLRNSLTAIRAGRNALADEFALLDALLSIQQIRFGERLRYTIDLPDECRALPVPPMLLQPLVENAVKHGVEPSMAGGAVSVSARLAQVGSGAGPGGRPCLILTVSDDGAGFPARGSSGHATAGVGLANVRERLYGIYGPHGTLTLSEGTPRGVVATLTLPLDTRFQA
ncbi:signal transduction histidine kinase [Pandoraea terrae]|uniref:Signal transduction histidine kinase n=1 Tax=Pandoraea terrae TaxID=1537710 RepID=A0A5E4WR45_9BURK|nr:histidine kinase [Pandoraea terrae]VVE27387.1 signal transduction histidine kinase [Pandoraea terrae]